MKRWTRILPVLLLLNAGLHADAFRDHWFSGAEINRYELTQSRYGAEHPGYATLIFVTEPFLPEAQVKDERGSDDSVDVLKLNALRTFNTGIYAYRTMRSTFSPIDSSGAPQVLKSNLTVQDWCGQVFQQVNRRNGQLEFQQRSYFQSEGDSEQTLEGVLMEDELWTWIRIDPASLPTGSHSMLPGALFLRFGHLQAQSSEAVMTIKTKGELTLYTIQYPALGRTLTIHFDQAFPHTIREWTETQRGSEAVTHARLVHQLQQVPYWRQNTPSDAVRRKALGLSPEPH